MHTRIPLALLAAAALAPPVVVQAADGVYEINQACAAQGCFPNDLPGFPVTITAPGSYRLTGNLEVKEIASAIQLETDHVTVDLNGFHVSGPVVCTGTGGAITCDGDGGFGIYGVNAGGRVATVRNGHVRGFRTGVLMGQGLVAEVVAWSNTTAGISVDAAVVSRSVASGNGGLGINVNAGSVVEHSTAFDNKTSGIFANVGSTVFASTASRNGGAGIATAAGAVVRGCAAWSNAGLGLSLGAGAGYAENALRDNAAPQVSGGIQTGGNACGAALCP